MISYLEIKHKNQLKNGFLKTTLNEAVYRWNMIFSNSCINSNACFYITLSHLRHNPIKSSESWGQDFSKKIRQKSRLLLLENYCVLVDEKPIIIPWHYLIKVVMVNHQKLIETAVNFCSYSDLLINKWPAIIILLLQNDAKIYNVGQKQAYKKSRLLKLGMK